MRNASKLFGLNTSLYGGDLTEMDEALGKLVSVEDVGERIHRLRLLFWTCVSLST